MRTLLLASLLALATTAACTKAQDAPLAAEADVPAVSIDELDALLARGACQAVDANSERTRKRMGVIPGALLLTDADVFLPSDLPADKSKPLVFYCANQHCGASHEAAIKARTAGHTDVKVLPDGIAGWAKAGKKVQML